MYRYVLLPMAFRIIIPPLTSETMNLIKNSSIALTIGLAELTFRSREIGEYTFNFFEAFTRGDRHLHRVRDDRQPCDGVCRAAKSRFPVTSPAANERIAMNLDFSVVISDSLPYLWKGMQYTLQLTAISAIGGLFFGTLLALARLSPNKILSIAAAGYVNLMRSIPLVLVIFWFFFLVPLIAQGITGSERPIQVGAERTAMITFILFEAAYFCEIMRAGIQSIPRGQVYSAYALGPHLSAGDAARDLAAGIPQHDSGSVDADDHPVSGHFSGLRHFGDRLCRCCIQDRPARLAPGRDVSVRGGSVFRAVLHAFVSGQAAAKEDCGNSLTSNSLRSNSRNGDDRMQGCFKVVWQLSGADQLHHRMLKRAR